MKGLLAVSPLLVFVVIYVVSSVIAGDFYKMPLTVAFLLASVYAVLISRGLTLSRAVEVFGRGAGGKNVMLMLWIFILAGAFANSAKEAGCIDTTVDLTIFLLPDSMLLAGLFVSACFISMAVGTSVGTIVALAPLAAGIAANTGVGTALVVGAVVGGSFFGDNLSFISDTTIAATQTQGCRMSDKFRVNSMLVIPVAAAIFAIYLFLGRDIKSHEAVGSIELLKVLPYLVVLVTAMMGMNVLAVLVLGIMLAGVVGIGYGEYDIFGWCRTMGDGIIGMGELIIITMMAAGMLELIKENGGLDFIISRATRRISTKRGAELCIAALVSLVNVCTANNTVAIITTGGVAKQIADRYGVDNRKSASILDTMSCCVQGLIPYGAQLLMASGLTAIAPTDIIPCLYYPMAIGLVTIVAIILRLPKRYS